jgi:hypothetical protein
MKVRADGISRQIWETRQIRYDIAKWVSYILFTLGWGLTFYGQLSGKPGLPSENQAG